MGAAPPIPAVPCSLAKNGKKNNRQNLNKTTQKKNGFVSHGTFHWICLVETPLSLHAMKLLPNVENVKPHVQSKQPALTQTQQTVFVVTRSPASSRSCPLPPPWRQKRPRFLLAPSAPAIRPCWSAGVPSTACCNSLEASSPSR